MGTQDRFRQCSQCYTLNPDDSQFCSKCGSSIAEFIHTLSLDPGATGTFEKLNQFLPGNLFDNRYRIIEEIGRGGMGRVFKAEDTELNITVALKIINPRHSSDPEFIERFKKETLTARSISHENVIRIHDLGEAENIKYISMEYIKGQDLGDLVQTSGNLTIDTTINMLHQICEALKTAHKKGIVHQDLKPSNIMVDSGGRLYIMDFGLARSVYRAEDFSAKVIVGTPQYMAPEQVKGEKVDQRADIYSLGTILFEMLTGRQLFEAKSREEVMRKHVEEAPVVPSKLNPQIPLFLENIISKCLEKAPVKRFQDVEEIIAILNKHSIKPGIFVFERFIRRHWYVPVVILLLFAAVLFFSILKKKPSGPEVSGRRISLAIVYLTNNTGDKSLEYMRKAVTELLISDLLQSQHIRVITGDKIFYILQKLNLLENEVFSTEDLKNITAECGAEYILSGNFTRSTHTLNFNTFIHGADNMEIIGTQRGEARDENSIFALIDGLSREIKQDFNISAEEIARDIDEDVIKITTDSPVAFKHYVDGSLLFNQGKLLESNEVLEKAIALDPEFALAYRKMAENFFYLGKYDEGNKYLNRAVSFLNRVSDREYYLIQGMAAQTTQISIENYTKLLELYPDDLGALGLLGSLYRNIEEWDLAQSQFEKIIEIDDAEPLAIDNLSHIYMAKGLYAEARNIIGSRQEIYTDKAQFHWRLGLAYMCENQLDMALAETKKALAVNPDDLLVQEMEGHIYQLMGRHTEGEDVFRRMAASKNFIEEYLGRHGLCYIYLAQGKLDLMEAEINRGLALYRGSDFVPGYYNFKLIQTYLFLFENRLSEAQEAANQAVESALESEESHYIDFSHHLRGIIYAKRGRLEDARGSAEKLKQRIKESQFQNRLRHFHHLMGEIALEEGRSDQAIKEFQAALSLLSSQHFKSDMHILYLDSLASAFYRKGDLKNAKTQYERITSLTTGRIRWSDKYVLAFYHLGEICLKQEKQKEAAQYFQKFLNLWDHADADRIADVKEAQKRLSELE
jgi:serine/threonine protein kinase/Tfp pilus assembly protein PilF